MYMYRDIRNLTLNSEQERYIREQFIVTYNTINIQNLILFNLFKSCT